MKRAVFLFFHSGKCGKFGCECGKPVENRWFYMENACITCGKNDRYGIYTGETFKKRYFL